MFKSLKEKFGIIVLTIVLVLAVSIPIVNADNETNTAEVVNTTQTEANTSNDTSSGNEIMPISQDQNQELSQEPEQKEDGDNAKEQDVVIVGNDVTIDYVVDGNLFICANNVTLNSQVGGDVFVFANNVTVGEDGYIFSNLFAVAKRLDMKGSIYNLYALSNDINISGYVYRDIRVFTDVLSISGTVARNAFVTSSSISFDTSNEGGIKGSLTYSAENEISIPEGAVESGVNFNQLSANRNVGLSYLFNAIALLITVTVIWLLGLWLAPKFTKVCDHVLVKKPVSTILSGVLTPIILVCLFVLLLVLSITLNLAFLTILLLFILAGISSSIFIIAMSNLLCKKFKIEKRFKKYGALVLICIVLYLLTLIPYVGGIIGFIAVVLGLGIIVRYLTLSQKFKDSLNASNNTEEAKTKVKDENNKKAKA